jgi:hypothetical protein
LSPFLCDMVPSPESSGHVGRRNCNSKGASNLKIVPPAWYPLTTTRFQALER